MKFTMEEVKYCTNCKRDINLKNYVIHTAHCERKIKLCGRCSEPVPVSELEKHEEEFHSKESCTECGISVEKWQIEKHKETCTKKLIPCEYCELEVPLDKLSEHTAACGSRTEPCSKCDKHVMLKDLKNHPKNCSKRVKETVPCEHCDLLIDWDDMTNHIAMCGTRTERCFFCNEHVMVKDRDSHFLNCGKALNLNQLISCDFCGASFSNDIIKRHVELCESQTEKCFRCDGYVQRKDMRLHLTNCKQKVQLLKLMCRYCGELFPDTFLKNHADVCEYRDEKCEICSKHIPLKNLEMHLVACEERRQSRLNKGLNPCKYCGKIFPPDLLEDHCNICASRNSKCENCGQYIPLKNIEAHLKECKEKRQLRRDIQCKYCGEFFLSDFLKDHVDKCGGKVQKCGKCEKYIEMKNMGTHSNICKENLSKNYGVCSICHDSIPWMEMNVHESSCVVVNSDVHEYERQNQFNELALRKEADANKIASEEKSQEENKKCSFCFNVFPYSFLPQHLRNCQERPYSCSVCLKAMPYRLKEDHERRCLGQRIKTHADDSMLRDEETDENKGLKKFKKCLYCDKRLPDVLFQTHLKECEHREEKCTLCLENVLVKDMQDHKCNSTPLAEKNKNSNYCNTYAKGIPDSPKNLERMSQLEENVEICPSCKCKIPQERYISHLALCYNAEKLCHFCWKTISKEKEHIHFQTCYKILEIAEEDKNSLKKKKKEKTNKGKSITEQFLSFWTSNKDKSYERNSTRETYEVPSWNLNRGQSYERGNITPTRPLTSNLNEVNELPCEFCNQMWPSELLIEHESGCRPDLVCFPQNDERKVDDQKFAAAAAAVTQISSSAVLGAVSKSAREETNEWKLQSKRSTENIDCRKMERNTPVKQLNAKEKFFYYPSQDSDDPKKQSANCRKKRYPQKTESQETAKIKSEKETSLIKDDSKRDEFISFKFSTSRFSEELQNPTNFRKENDHALSTDLKNYDENKKSNTYDRAVSSESRPVLKYPTSYFNREIKAVGAERTERKRVMHSSKDVDADLSLAQKGFEEMSLKKPIICDESSKNEPSKFLETIESRRFNLITPTIWNAECSSNDDKTFRSHFSKCFNNNYDNEAKDILFNASESIENRALNSSMQDTDYDVKNKETFGKSFVESINNYNQNELEEDATRSDRSNSDETFYDADDGGENYFDKVNDNFHGSSNTQVALNRYDLDNLNFSRKNQKENAKPSSHDDTSVDNELEEEDFNQKDCDLDGYFEFLHGRFESLASTKSSNEAAHRMLSGEENFTYRIPKDCKCGNKECCCIPSSSIEKMSLQACSLKGELCSKSSELTDIEPIVEGSKTSDQIKFKKSIEFSKKKVEDESIVDVDTLNWKKWRVPQEKIVFSSDSE